MVHTVSRGESNSWGVVSVLFPGVALIVTRENHWPLQKLTALKLVLAEGSFHYVIFFQLKCSFHWKYCPAKIYVSIFGNFVSIPGHFGIFLSSRCVMAVKSRSKEMWLSWSFLQPSISFNFLFCFFMESTPSQIIVLPYNGLSHSWKTVEKPINFKCL